MLEIVDLFREKGTVDDLGYGIVRDAISDYLFPGVSVLHTRPRYLLLVGWIYASLLDERSQGQGALERGRRLELGIIPRLMEGGETQGVIGRVAGQKLKRLPSAAYWAALRTYGLLNANLSRESYCRALPALRSSSISFEEGQQGTQRAWRLPPLPEDFQHGGLTLTLTSDEGHFLYERVMGAAGDAYLGWLLNQPIDDTSLSPWTHASVADAPDRVRHALEIAEHYSLAQHGPTLLYNLMVARVAHREELVTRYEDELEQWIETMDRRFPVDPYPIEDLWRLTSRVGARVTPATRDFVTWTVRMSPGERAGLAADTAAADRVKARELALKRSLSRLSGGRSLDGWSGASGTGLLEYRWQSVVPMVNDIVLARESSHA